MLKHKSLHAIKFGRVTYHDQSMNFGVDPAPYPRGQGTARIQIFETSYSHAKPVERRPAKFEMMTYQRQTMNMHGSTCPTPRDRATTAPNFSHAQYQYSTCLGKFYNTVQSG